MLNINKDTVNYNLNMLHDAVITGDETKQTFEMSAVQVMLKNMCADMFKLVHGFDLTVPIRCFTYAGLGMDYMKIGVYDVSKYINMIEQVRVIANSLDRNSLESRQLIVQFETIHCFQHIQFLIRNDNLTVIASMRSCNFETHFCNDAMLTYMCGRLLADILERRQICTINNIDVIMQIGSLHIFKKEGK